jgi:hypothetical protein
MDGLEGSGKCLANHQALGQFVGEKIIALVGEEIL